MPIDIASGSVRLEFDDIVIPGKVDLVWNRLYTTKLLELPGTAMGLGWTSKYYATLTKTPEGYQYSTPDGDLEVFADPEHSVDRGGLIQRLGTYEELFREDGRYIVQNWDIESGEILRYCFQQNQPDSILRLTSLEGVTGQALDLIWDTQGRLAEIRQRLENRALVMGYSPSSLITSILLRTPTGEQHQLVRYEYDSNGRLITAYDAAKFADRYDYDAKGRVQREIVKDGGIFQYRYDDKGRCIRTSGIDHYAEKRLRFFDAIGFTEVTDSYGRTFRYQHLPSGQMVREIDPLGNEKTTDYDEHGRIIAKTDASGAKTLYGYDQFGNYNRITDALGNTTQFTYNAHHLPLSMTDALGQVWRRAYDNANRLIATMDPLEQRWYIGYDQEGNVAEITNPLGAKKHQHYEHGSLKAVTDWLGNITHFKLDGFGRVTHRKGALGEITRFRYDLLGNPIEVVLPDAATLRATYDNVGNLTSFIDANGNATRFRYGPCQRLLERVDPVGGVVRYVWGNEPGRLEQVINERGETYAFFRDDAGRIIREQSFDNAERHFNYDAEGYAVAYTNANAETITIQRDALHRVIGQTLPDGEQVSYGFDPVGNLLSAVNADIPVSFELDPLGRIVKEIQSEHWVESAYDAVGNLIHTATSLGHTVDYEVDANGFVSKLTTLGNQSLEFKRNAYGQETHRQMPGNVVMEQRYDDLGRLVEQRVGPGRLGNGDASVIPEQREIIRRNYSYDRNSSLTSIVDGRWGRVDYVYDPAERLLQAIREQGPSESFSYDATGNMTRMQTQDKDSSSDETLIYGAGNRLLQKGNTRYEYDAEGRRVKKIEGAGSDNPKVWLYEWNALDRLKAVTRPDGEVWQYKYDALARRIEKAGTKTKREFLWHENIVIQEIESGQSLSAWVFDAYSFAPIAMFQRGGIYSIINDHLGTPREIVDSGGAVVWSMALKSWGQELTQSSVSGILTSTTKIEQNLRFPGQYFDEESGLHYNRYRYYDPKTGRYVSDDPLGLLGGINGYQYAPNPTGFIDPCGLTGNPANATHITYEGVKDGKPYIGYASKPGLGHSADDVLKYRYPNTDHFDVPPKPFYVGEGLEGKQTARGLEQRVFEDRGGLKGTSNLQNPVGENNDNRDKYLAAADKHRAEEAEKKEKSAKKKGKKQCG